MKKILVFVDWYLPGFKAGGPIRSMANMVSALKDRYQFFIVCGDTDYLEKVPYQNIESDRWIKISENESVNYISSKRLTVKHIRSIIKSADADIVYINGIYSFYFSIVPIVLSKLSKIKRIIVAPRGMLSSQAYSSKKLKKKIFLTLAKLSGFYKNISFHVTSVEEETDLQSMGFYNSKILRIPNLPPGFVQNEKQNKEKIKGELKLVSIARISPEKNTLFALQTLLKNKFEGILALDIYGTVNDKLYWKQCLEIISQLPENIEVVYKGGLSNNQVINTLQKYDFLYLPSKGENFGHSILEAFLAGCPVIISNKTPWRKLEEQGLGWDLELDMAQFADIIQRAIDLDNNEYKVLSDFTWSFSLKLKDNKELKEAYHELFR
jgi:glycosyltransferase involved in cell wall biosynthesis